MQLSSLFNTINIIKTYNFNKNSYFSSVTANSKLTNKSTIFIFDKNSKSKKKYINEALKNKIPAIISNKYLRNLNIPQFVVTDINYETKLLLKKIYPSTPSNSIAITGTNGKTSVVWYISKILKLINYSNSTVGTLGYYRNGKKINDISLTTPAYEELYKYGSSDKKINNTYIFEASSHALDQNRLRDYPINIAAITNISIDHLDYHKNKANYKKAKLKLFTKYLSSNGTAVINSRIKNISTIEDKLNKKNIKIIYFGDKYISLVKKKTSYNLDIYKKKFLLKKLKISNEIELENLECAIACCLALKIDKKRILKVLSKIDNPPGRFQTINYKKKNSKIIIDYAHTPDALRRLLKSFSKKPILVFGCGGDRDKNKRKNMGLIADRYSYKTYVTDDNPRYENASKIRKNILKFCKNGIEVPNRKTAIKKAIKELYFNDTLIIAGKGHENFQLIKNKKNKFDDFKIVKEILKNEH